MLSPFDDYPIQQVPRPITVHETTDRNAYGRYWFGAQHREGRFIVEAAFGRYPNLGVVDAHVSIMVDGVQHSFHASAAAPVDPTDTSVGPYRLEIIKPMRELRITVDPNDTGITAELSWRSRVGALLEDHTIMEDRGRRLIDMARFVQFGTWTGWVSVDGRCTELVDTEVVGVRDRSWGVRPVGERVGGRPSTMRPNAWLWAPMHFDDECRTMGFFQRAGGEFWRPDGFRIPVVDPVAAVTEHDAPGVYRIDPVGQRLTFEKGTRWVTHAEFDVHEATGGSYVLEIESLCRFHMRGIGYGSPEWAHGVWKGPLAIGREDWALADVNPQDLSMQHLHHVARARIGDRVGVGLFEQIIVGPHTQFGFKDLADGA